MPTIVGSQHGATSHDSHGRARTSSRLSFMVSLRVRYLLDRDERGDGVVKRGIGSLITRFGAGVGVRL